MSWFKKSQPAPVSPPNSPVVYPSETCVVTEDGEYFYLKGRYKFKIPSLRAVESWRFDHIVSTTNAALSNYTLVGKLGFRGGTLLRSIGTGKYYLVSENKRRHVVSPDALTALGITMHDAVIASTDEIGLHEEGEVLK